MPFFKEEKLVNVLNWIPNIKRIKPIEITKYTIEGKKYPFYGQQLDNNGIIDYISVEDKFLIIKIVMYIYLLLLIIIQLIL